MIRNIIFDWSGTLVDDLPAVWRATNFVLSQCKCTEMTLEQFRAEFCLPFTDFYDRHVPHVPLKELEGWFHTHFREAQHSVVALPRAKEFLEFCRERGLRTFVLSTVHPDYYAIQAASTGFGEYIEHPYTGVWDKRKKIHDLLAEQKLEPNETLFIGDMQHDMETARHGGVLCCGVLTGYNTLEQLRASEPDLIVEHLGELQQVLTRNRMNLVQEPGEAHDRPPVVTVGGLIRDSQGQVLLVRTHKWSNLWGIPGGKVKRGETCVAALARELMEETHLDVEDIRFVMVQDCISSPEFYRDEHFVLLNYTCLCKDGQEVRLNEEAREFQWMTNEESQEICLNAPTRVLLKRVSELEKARASSQKSEIGSRE